MASIIQQLDLDLCRRILLRTEEVMGSNRPRGPENYQFEGYGPEMVEFNIRKLHDNKMICARERREKRRGVINCWPEILYDRGLDFLEATRDEKIWNAAMEEMRDRGRNDTPTLTRMRIALMEAAERKNRGHR